MSKLTLTDHLNADQLASIAVILSEHATSLDDAHLQICICDHLTAKGFDVNVADDLAYAIVYDAKRTLPKASNTKRRDFVVTLDTDHALFSEATLSNALASVLRQISNQCAKGNLSGEIVREGSAAARFNLVEPKRVTVELTDAQARLLEQLLQARQEIATPGAAGALYRSARRALLPAIVDADKRPGATFIEIVSTPGGYVVQTYYGSKSEPEPEARPYDDRSAAETRARFLSHHHGVEWAHKPTTTKRTRRAR
jgi:hypothetical protein